jgi:transposase
MPIPQAIKDLKPVEFGKIEIRDFKGKYYVYPYHYEYDEEKGRSKKVTDKMIGKITLEDGFVRSKKYSIKPTSISVKGYGVYTLFEQLNKNLYSKLKKYYPGLYREIFTIAALQLVNKCTNKNIKEFYDNSSLSLSHPDLRLSENTITKLFETIGNNRPVMIDFMRSYTDNEATLLFDGTNIFTQSSKSSYAKKGYNYGKRKSTQINLLYVFNYTTHAPVYYRLLPGNIVDRATLVKTIHEAGIKNCTIIADKGFYSKANNSFLDENGLNYILPLQSNTKYISDDFVEENGTEKYDDFLIYHKRPIWYKKMKVGEKGHFLYIFMDTDLKQVRESLYLEKIKCGWKGYTREKFNEKLKKNYLAFISNIDEDPQQIYLRYKGRWEIEECFDYLKNSLKVETPYQDSNEKIEAWAFINHISLIIFYNLINKIKEKDLSNKYTPEDIINISKNIYKIVLDDGQEIRSETTQREKDLFSELGLSFE